MTNIIEIENQYYIRAQSSLADNRTRVLMRGDAFAFFDRHGEPGPEGPPRPAGTPASAGLSLTVQVPPKTPRRRR
jgi:hypothetical protein